MIHAESRLGRLRARLDVLSESRAADAPPFAVLGGEETPVVGVVRRFRRIVTDPTGLALAAWERYRRPHTLRIPFFFDLTYLDGRDGYRFVLDLDPEVARMGPVMGRVPTVGFWFPRSDDGEAHLQRLILAARAFMAEELAGRARLADAGRLAEDVARAHAARWAAASERGELDLGVVVVDAIYDAFGRSFAGDALWGRLAEEATPLYRAIADGINIPRTTLATVPLTRMVIKERRATRRLARLLTQVIGEHDRTGRYPLIDRIRAVPLPQGPDDPAPPALPEGDVAWMLMYVLWNALTYPGTYGFWALADLISRPEALAAVEEGTLSLDDALLETLRLHPVSSLVRETTRPVAYDSPSGQRYTIPPGGYVGTFPYVLNRDPAHYAAPDAYDPARFGRGEPQPLTFGRGAFGCVAASLVLTMLPAMLRVWLDGWSFRLAGPLPERMTRVHLIYPDRPVPARVVARASAGGPSPRQAPARARATQGCPVHGRAPAT